MLFYIYIYIWQTLLAKPAQYTVYHIVCFPESKEMKFDA